MDANQLIKELGDAVAAAKSPQEYCFLWIDWWPTCMTKAEWSGWMQAIGSAIALMVAIGIGLHQAKEGRRVTQEAAWRAEWQVSANAYAILTSVHDMFSGIFKAWRNATDLEELSDTVKIEALPAIANMVRSVPLMQLPDPMAASALVGLPEVMDELSERMSALVEHLAMNSTNPHQYEKVVSYFETVASRVTNAEKSMFRSLGALAVDSRRPGGVIPFEDSIRAAVESGLQNGIASKSDVARGAGADAGGDAGTRI